MADPYFYERANLNSRVPEYRVLYAGKLIGVARKNYYGRWEAIAPNGRKLGLSCKRRRDAARRLDWQKGIS